MVQCLKSCVDFALQLGTLPGIHTLVISASLCFKGFHTLCACRFTDVTQVRDDIGFALSCIRSLLFFEWYNVCVKCNQDFSRDLITTELCKQFLLCRKIQILVVHNLIPDTFG